jgi:hypothetical protein
VTNFGWSLLQAAAQLLERDEREAVLGDLLETGESACQGSLDVLGLVIRRQAILWKSWRPWLAAFGLVLPSTLLLMGASVSIGLTCRRLLDPSILARTSLTVRHGLVPLMCQVFLLVAWSWTGGFVVGSVSRRTLWVSAVLCASPCLFCLARFRIESLSRFCLLLFLLPAIVGVRQGMSIIRIKSGPAIVLAVALAGLMIANSSNRGPTVASAALIWPAWYIVATARRPDREPGRR